VELPNWVVDEVLLTAKPTAFRLAIMLYRHGRQVVDGDGNRRVYWRGSLQQLARLTGARKQALIDAQLELAAAGLLALHETLKPNSGHAISAPYDRPGGTNFVPPFSFETPPHGDVKEEPPSHQDNLSPTTTTPGPEEAVRISDRLAELGVSHPRQWLIQFGADRCDTALAILADNRRRGYQPRNPAGFLHSLLTSSQPLERPPERYDPNSFLSRKEQYTGGRFGHLATWSVHDHS